MICRINHFIQLINIKGGGLLMKLIQIKNLSFNYYSFDEELQQKISHQALNDISIDIDEGSFVAILGHNGSGKSTLAQHLNGIYKSSKGDVLINGLNTKDDEHIWDIKKTVNMVFQNPDNQIVTTIVQDDVAFGPENLGLPRDEIISRINFALDAVNMQEFRHSNISNLSGGQKQRIAIAGVLAMLPKCIVLDEPTAMLDPKGRQDIISTIKKLNKEKGITIVLITHYMEEVVDVDRLIIMEKGSVILDDTPINVFQNIDLLKSINLTVPISMEITHKLNELGHKITNDMLDINDFINKLIDIGIDKDYPEIECIHSLPSDEKIRLSKVSYTYSPNTVFEKLALSDINLTINRGDFFGIIGHTGSGKSTLIQMLNALTKPSVGDIFINRENIYKNKISLKHIRQQIGVVFQYPEYQLFEETVYKDVAFAPTNLGFSKEEIDQKVCHSLDIVGLDKSYYNKSPFELSGGEKRRVAIAGVLAMSPDVLVFDELTAGLDPHSRDEILRQIKDMQTSLNMTIVLVSHSMEDIAKVCNKLLVLNNGKIVFNTSLDEVFKNGKILENIGLDIPKYSKLFHMLNDGGYNFPTNVYTSDQCVNILNEILHKNI